MVSLTATFVDVLKLTEQEDALCFGTSDLQLFCFISDHTAESLWTADTPATSRSAKLLLVSGDMC